MSDIGPTLPPHLLAKRKRQQEEASQDGPATDSGAKRARSPNADEKRRKVMGPAMPPASLDERPTHAPNAAETDSDDDDDDLGPALPKDETDEPGPNDRRDNSETLRSGNFTSPPAPEKLRRDDWMMMPPKQDDLAARLDPSKQRARGFNTGKGAKGANALGDDNSMWNETPAQKQKRLQDEMMGVASSTHPSPGPQKPGRASQSTKSDDKTRERVQEKSRGPSLMDQHKQTAGPEAEDDPSKRAFDREKDMGSGMRIGHTQRKEMLNKAAGFTSKFSGGSYL